MEVQQKAKEEALITEGEFPFLLLIYISCFRAEYRNVRRFQLLFTFLVTKSNEGLPSVCWFCSNDRVISRVETLYPDQIDPLPAEW